jgi:hypothetical protein
VLSLYLSFALIFAAISVFLWVGTLFFQGHLYNEPVSQLFWRAPLAGLALTLYLAFWCSLDYRHPGDYGTIFDFSPGETEVFPSFVAVKDSKEVTYLGKKGPRGHFEYRDAQGKPWRRSDPAGVTSAILVKDKDGADIRFDAKLTPDGKFALNDQGQAIYVEKDGKGRVMTDDYIGSVSRTRTGLLIANLFLNILLFAVWLLCLWLLLDFQFWHAFGFGLILWLALMLTILPMLFKNTEDTAHKRVQTVSWRKSLELRT